jgi:hypothetical protein
VVHKKAFSDKYTSDRAFELMEDVDFTDPESVENHREKINSIIVPSSFRRAIKNKFRVNGKEYLADEFTIKKMYLQDLKGK